MHRKQETWVQTNIEVLKYCAYVLKARIVMPAEKAIAWEWLCKHPLPGNSSVAIMWSLQHTHTTDNCWKRCSLWGLCQGYKTSITCQYKRVSKWQLEWLEARVRWLPACKGMSLGAEKHPLLEDIRSSAVKTMTENISWCVTVICKV
jgi:hypothetical protein